MGIYKTIFRKTFEHSGVLLFFLAGAIVSTYPLIRHFTTIYMGSSESDAQTFAWNVWYFRWALLHSVNPLYSDFQYWPIGSNLLFHSYALFNNFIGYFLQPLIGLIPTLNTLSLASHMLSGWGAYLLLRYLGLGRAVSLWGGFIFSFHTQTAVLVGREFDYMWIATIPFFILSFLKAQADPRPWRYLISALALTWTWLCSPYYFNFNLILMGLLTFVPFLEIKWLERAPGGPLRKTLGWAALTLAAAGGAWLSMDLKRHGQMEFHGAGGFKEILRYVAPYWTLGAAALLALLRWFPRRPVFNAAPGLLSWKNISPALWMLVCWAALNAPVLWTVWALGKSGIGIEQTATWRGGGITFDLLNYALPYLEHRFFKFDSIMDAPLRGGAIGISIPVFLYFFHRRYSISSIPKAYLWLICGLVSAVLSLGPYLEIAKFKTYIPMPFWLIRQLPVVGNMFGVNRFITINFLVLGIVGAMALDYWLKRKRGASRYLILAAAFAIPAFEFWHVPITPKTSPNYPTLFKTLREAPEGAVLYLPFGALFRDPRYDLGEIHLDDLYYQTSHQKPMINGAYGRTASYVAHGFSTSPFLRALASKGDNAALKRYLTDPQMLKRALQDFGIRYVLIDTKRTQPWLQELVKRRWRSSFMGREAHLELYAIELLNKP